MRRLAMLLPLLLAFTAVPGLAAAQESHQRVVDLTFPVAGASAYSDSYDAARGGGTRVHRATDIMAAEGNPVHAAVGGHVEWLTGVGGAVPSYGYMIRIAGDDGRDYAYIHLGRQDGPASRAYAPGLAEGSRIRRGQHIGYVGCSGNASCDAPHLHFEIHDPAVTDPFGYHQVNPYPSLQAAGRRGDIPRPEPFVDVRSATHRGAILAIADAGISKGCRPWHFCPGADLTREQMATFIVRALDVGTTGKTYFSDISASHHRSAINALAAAGITSGCGDGRYCPGERLSRGQMASLLSDAFRLPPAVADHFTDDDDSVHEDAVNRVRAAGITNGFPDGTYRTGGTVTRQQMATFLARALDL